jgi:hypothetical protein
MHPYSGFPEHFAIRADNLFRSERIPFLHSKFAVHPQPHGGGNRRTGRNGVFEKTVRGFGNGFSIEARGIEERLMGGGQIP